MTEIWKPIPGWPWYEASSLGRIRSIDRMTVRSNGRPYPRVGVVLKCYANPAGYYVVRLSDEVKPSKQQCVHQLIARAFRGPKPEVGSWARHLNDVQTDNRESNIAWGSPRQNALDIKHNNWSRRFVLSLEQVREIKIALKEPYRGLGRALAAKYGVSAENIAAINTGRSHSDIVV